MESVEELCSHIALINNAKVILDGSVKEIRKKFRSNTYQINFHGNRIGFTNALWSGFELLDLHEEQEMSVARVKMLNNQTTNQLLSVLLPHVEVVGLHEVIPDMNDIFIQQINNAKLQVA